MSQLPLQMNAGTSFTRKFRLLANGEPRDLTGHVAAVHIRAKVTDLTPLISLSSETTTIHGSGINIDIAESTVEIVITPQETKDLTQYEKGKDINGVWDLRVYVPTGEHAVYYPTSDFIISAVSTRGFEIP